MNAYESPKMVALSFTPEDDITLEGNLTGKGSRVYNDGEIEW